MPSGILFLLGLYLVYFLGICAVLRMGLPSTTTKRSQSKKHQKIFSWSVLLLLSLLLTFFKPMQHQMTLFFRYHTTLGLFYDYHNKKARKGFKFFFENKPYPISLNKLTSHLISALQSTDPKLKQQTLYLYSEVVTREERKKIDPVLLKKLTDLIYQYSFPKDIEFQKKFEHEIHDVLLNALWVMWNATPEEFVLWASEAFKQDRNRDFEMNLIDNLIDYEGDTKILIPQLLKILPNRIQSHREEIIILLTQLGAKEILPEVLQILREGELQLQRSILEALEFGNLYDESFLPLFAKLFKEVPQLRYSLLFLLSQIPQMDIALFSEILQNLKTSNNFYRIESFFKKQSEKENFISVLLQNLPNAHQNVRYLILYFLGIFGNQDLLPTLKSYFEDPYPFVATIANWAHFHIQQKGKTPLLLEELLKSSEKQQCLYALVEIQKNPEMETDLLIPLLEKLTQQEDIQIFQQAILSLYTATKEEEENRLKTLSPLYKNLKDQKEAVRSSALWYLAQINLTDMQDAIPTVIPILIQCISDTSPDIQEFSFFLFEFLQNLYSAPLILTDGKKHFFDFFSLLNHSDPVVQKRVALYLDQISYNAYYPLLLKAQPILIQEQLVSTFLKLLETNSELEILLGLRGMVILFPESKHCLSKIEALASHPNPKIRREVMMSLKHFADPSSLPFIHAALHDSDETVISAALEVLDASFKPTDLIYQEIFPFLKQKQFGENAAKALGYFAPPPQEFAKVLHDSLLENNEEVSNGVLEALWYNRAHLRAELSSFLPFLWERAKKLDSQEQAKFTDILAEIPSQEIIPELQKWCHDKNVAYRRFALETLLKMNTFAKGAREELLDLFENETENTLRILLLKIFRNIPDPKIMSQLIVHLPSATLGEQYEIISTLRNLKDPLSVPILLTMAQQENQELSLLAKEALTNAFKIDFRWNILQKILGYFWGTLAGIFSFRFLLKKILFLNSTKE